MSKPILLEDWSTGFISNDPYLAPEQKAICLQGMVTGHPRREGKHGIRTSSVAGVKGRIIATRSGSVYRLGKIDPTFRKWLKKHRPNWDWRNPVKMLGGDDDGNS